MAPMMVAPALIGLMYRLILHEFVGVIPYYLWEWVGDSPAFLGTENAFLTLVTIEILQWTPFALLILYTAYRAIPPTFEKLLGWMEPTLHNCCCWWSCLT